MLKKKFEGKIHRASKDKSYEMEMFYYSANNKVVHNEPKSKKKIWSLLFFVVNIFVIAIVLAIQLNSEEGISSIGQVFSSNIKGEFILIAVLCFLVSNLVSSFKLDIYYKKFHKKY